MGRKNSLTGEEKGRISAYHEEGVSNREIARRIDRSAKVVNNFLRLGDAYGSKKSIGCPKSLTEQEKRAIRHAATNNTRGVRRFQKEFAPNVSHQTVYNVLKATPHLRYKKMNKAPQLNHEHQHLTAQFADEHQTWKNEWDTVFEFPIKKVTFII